MRRLWHRLNVPSPCIYCTQTLLFPPLLSRPSLFSKSYQTLFPSPLKTARETSTEVHTNKPALLADFYRSLSTQDIDCIWPLYTYLYTNDLLSTLTRKNFHHIFLYTIRARASQKNLLRLTALTDDMRKRGFQLRLNEYNSLIHWVGGKTVPNLHPHHLLDALKIFEDMQKPELVTEAGEIIQKEPVQPSVVTFNTLIDIAVQLSDIRTAQRLYHDMVSRHLQPDVYTYSSLLHSMGKMGDVSGMDHMLNDIRNNGLNTMAKNTAIWNVVMSGYACNGFKDRTYAMFEQMVEAYSKDQKKKKKKHKSKINSTTPALKQVPITDAESYRIYIDLMVHDNRRDEAIRVLYNMETLGIKPTITIYNTLFGSFMKSTKFHLYDEEVDPEQTVKLNTLQQLYKSMKDTQVKPNSETMYTLVSAFLDLGDTKSALGAFVSLSNISQTLSTPPARKSIQSNSVATLAKERLLLANRDPTKIEPYQELLDRLNGVVTKSL
ncbi:hypothetical protein INT47_003919 [Mucor saturninus]|uniref:Pentatricopeptide repeat-containing protein n=1 Tax=Mucor saturninus TaxID=64648 RepID=A0A8H7UWU9_9FUNG|nr:hypothetical protein INT47_003919 [Mucor saturninus]